MSNIERSPSLAPAARSTGADRGLELRIAELGSRLAQGLRTAVTAAADPNAGPIAVAARLDIDKVLASRLLKALRTDDPFAFVHRAPGPEPLRRVVKAVERRTAGRFDISEVWAAIDDFDQLINLDIGDRSALETILAGWVPEARREFELRRKQSAFRAMSQLKGAQARTLMATVLLAPSADGEKIDIAWVSGLMGLHRLRPGAVVKFATRRLAPGGGRKPSTLDGAEIDDLSAGLLAEYCTIPTPPLAANRQGEVTHYTLRDGGFGPETSVDLVFCEVNRGDLDRYDIAEPQPDGRPRVRYFFAEVSTPAERLQFDAIVHRSLFAGQDPALRLYDTAFEGVANPNDPSRDADLLELRESIRTYDDAPGQWDSGSDVPRYDELTTEVIRRMGWNPREFRGYRCEIEYPVYGAQVTMTFRRESRPAT